MENAIERLRALNPCRFAFKTAPECIVDGFIAHEVASVVPEAVNGQKDAVDEAGDIIPQALDFGRLVPVLVAAVQALISKVEALEARS